MIKYRIEKVEQKIPESITCDICKKEYNYNTEYLSEIQEFQNIKIEGGYNSVFGDGVGMKIDICQHCLKDLLGKYLVEDSIEDSIEDSEEI